MPKEDISLYARYQIFKNKFNIEELQKNTNCIKIYSDIMKYLWLILMFNPKYESNPEYESNLEEENEEPIKNTYLNNFTAKKQEDESNLNKYYYIDIIDLKFQFEMIIDDSNSYFRNYVERDDIEINYQEKYDVKKIYNKNYKKINDKLFNKLGECYQIINFGSNRIKNFKLYLATIRLNDNNPIIEIKQLYDDNDVLDDIQKLVNELYLYINNFKEDSERLFVPGITKLFYSNTIKGNIEYVLIPKDNTTNNKIFLPYEFAIFFSIY
jgi:hypothetical protein